jgi:hypothetical protein
MRTWRDTRGWLLIEKQSELAHRQLHPPKQRENPQPRRVGEGLQQVCEGQRVHPES